MKSLKSNNKRKSHDTKPHKQNDAAKYNKTNYKKFICVGSNGTQMIIEKLLSMDLKVNSDIKDQSFYFKWTDVPHQVEWSRFVEFEHIINHIPNSEVMTDKGNLLHNLRQHERLSKSMQKSSLIALESFVPESYMINNPKELNRFYENFQNSDIWIYKPTGLNQGIGISLIRDRVALREALSRNENESNQYRRPMGHIVQRYIMNPLLINNKKFDIRAYMLIGNTAPFLVLYHPGYLRLSMENYSNESDNLLIHLTNQFVQKKDPKYKDVKEDTVWSMEQFNRHCNEHLAEYPGIYKNWVQYVLSNRIKSIMRQVFFSVKNKLSRGVGLFELFGFDFMIDADFKTWLIEVNMNPALNTNCEVLKQKLPILIQSTLETSIECFEKCKKQESLLPLKNAGSLEVIYYEDARWSWQQYINNNKEMLPFMKIRKISNNSHAQRAANNVLLKARPAQSSQVIQPHRSQSVPLAIERKFPLNLTHKDYQDATANNNQKNSKWIKI